MLITGKLMQQYASPFNAGRLHALSSEWGKNFREIGLDEKRHNCLIRY